MNSELVDTILDHANPARVLREVQEALSTEEKRRREFREWLKPDVKAEFIAGEVILHSPALHRHNRAVLLISILLENYAGHYGLGQVAVEKALIGLERNDVEPDVNFWKTKQEPQLTAETLVYPAPDLIVEVLSKSTARRDRGVKMDSYAEARVKEYWIVDPKLEQVEQYVLQRTTSAGTPTYGTPATFSGNDAIQSKVVDGFSVPVAAFFSAEHNREQVRKIYVE